MLARYNFLCFNLILQECVRFFSAKHVARRRSLLAASGLELRRLLLIIADVGGLDVDQPRQILEGLSRAEFISQVNLLYLYVLVLLLIVGELLVVVG